VNDSALRGYSRIRTVASFEELVSARFEAGVNAVCWPRSLDGDFAEIAALCRTRSAASDSQGVTLLDPLELSKTTSSPSGRRALRVLEDDLSRLAERDLEPVLNCVTHYRRDDSGLLPTDVYSFHADRCPVEVDTWLCTYHGEPTQGLRNDQAVQKITDPVTQRALRHAFARLQSTDRTPRESFEQFVRSYNYDLHFAPVEGATPWSFGLGWLWRVAVSWPGSSVPPCLHRAPNDSPNRPRLLLIA
jgi:hypothetical protein